MGFLNDIEGKLTDKVNISDYPQTIDTALDGVPITIAFSWDSGQAGGRDDPSWEAGVDDYVVVDSEGQDITDAMSPEEVLDIIKQEKDGAETDAAIDDYESGQEN